MTASVVETLPPKNKKAGVAAGFSVLLSYPPN
jgi:hypothetical protein